MPHILLRFLKIFRFTSDDRYRPYWLALLMAGLVLYGAGGMYYFERGSNEGIETPGDALWWAIVTMTTVGYGDIYPGTWQGRWLVALPTMVIGIGVLGYAIGLITNAVLERQGKEVRGRMSYDKEGQIVICHCPSTESVLEVVREIRADAHWERRDIVLVTSRFETFPEELRSEKLHFVNGEPSREEILKQAGIERAASAMVLARDPGDPSSDNQTLGVIVTARCLAPELYLVAECLSRENVQLLSNAGASEVVGLGALAAGLLVQGLQDPGVNGVLSELVTNRSGHQIYIHPIRSFQGTYKELQARVESMGQYAALGIIQGEERIFLADGETRVGPGTKVMLLGDRRPGEL